MLPKTQEAPFQLLHLGEVACHSHAQRHSHGVQSISDGHKCWLELFAVKCKFLLWGLALRLPDASIMDKMKDKG